MKQGILGRYDRDEAGNSILDVTASRVEDLYDDFDKSSPYVRRDLDEDLVEYLIGCARELSRVPFKIRFTLAVPPGETALSRVRNSVNSYFLYLADIETQRLARMFRRSAILFVVGVAALFLSVWLNRLLGPQRSLVVNVFGEGLTLVAWISLWEAVAMFLIEWPPRRRNVKLYRRMAHAELLFRSAPDAAANPEEAPGSRPRSNRDGTPFPSPI